MKKISILLVFNLIFYSSIVTDPFEQLDIDFLKKKKIQEVKKEIKQKAPKSKLPAYEDKIKDLQIISGLFDFYWDKNKNHLFISIEPNQFGETYLTNITRQSGDAYYYSGSTLMGEFPFTFTVLASLFINNKLFLFTLL